jgi:hypothetical protein
MHDFLPVKNLDKEYLQAGKRVIIAPGVAQADGI